MDRKYLLYRDLESSDYAECLACFAVGPYNMETCCPLCGGELWGFEPQTHDRRSPWGWDESGAMLLMHFRVERDDGQGAHLTLREEREDGG